MFLGENDETLADFSFVHVCVMETLAIRTFDYPVRIHTGWPTNQNNI